MADDKSGDPFTEDEVQALVEKLAAWAGTLTPRERQWFVAQLAPLAAQQEADGDVRGYAAPTFADAAVGGVRDGYLEPLKTVYWAFAGWRKEKS